MKFLMLPMPARNPLSACRPSGRDAVHVRPDVLVGRFGLHEMMRSRRLSRL